MDRRVLALACVLLAVPSLAQQEYRLDDKGQWEARAPQRAPSEDEQTIARARQALADDTPSKAASILNGWIENHQTSDNALLPQAYLVRGDARLAMGKEFYALYDYEEVTLNYAGTEEFSRAVSRELDIGLRYLHGFKRRFLGMRIAPAYDIGEELLVRVQERLPGTPLAERACIELADYYYRNRDLATSSDAYEIYVTNFPKGPNIEKARLRRIYANLGRYKGPNYDTAGLVDARVLIEDYAARDPAGAQRAGLTDALLAKIDESQAAQLLERSKWYLVRGDPVSSRSTLRRLIRRFPGTLSANTALTLMKERGWTMDEPPASDSSAPAAASSDKPATESVPPTSDATPPEAAPGRNP